MSETTQGQEQQVDAQQVNEVAEPAYATLFGSNGSTVILGLFNQLEDEDGFERMCLINLTGSTLKGAW